MKNDRIKIFICYAHKDIAHREELEKYLKLLKKHDERIDSWSDGEIRPGRKWKAEIRDKLNESDLFLYLLSVDSGSSDACDEELTIARQKASPLIMPIHVEPYDWEADILIAELEMIPRKDGHLLAVSELGWGRPGSAWTEVSRAIRKEVDHIFEQRKTTGDSEIKNETRGAGSVIGERSKEADWNQDRLVEQGELSLILGQFDRAITDFDKALKLNAGDFKALCGRGTAYLLGKGEFDRAITDFDEALKLEPSYVEALSNRGIAYARKGELGRAIDDFDEALKLKPNDFEALSNRGAVYLRKGELDRAIADIDEAFKLKPDDFDVLLNRGAIYLREGEFDRAITDFDEALKLKQDDFKVLSNRGTAYLGKDKLDQAIADFDTALKLKPDNFELLLNRGIAYAEKGDHDQAIADVEQTLRLRHDFLNALALLAQLKG